MPMVRVVLAGVLLVALGQAAEAQRVGVTAAVNPRAISQPPGATERELLLGSDVIFNQRLSTHEDGLAQLLFVDRSMLTIGRNADVVIDAFVYDPATSTGKMTATITRGVGRYVGGALSKSSGQVTLRTPTATIGVRGGVVLFKVDDDGSTTVAMVHGREVQIATPAGVRQIFRNDYGVTVDRSGAFVGGGPSPVSRELQSSITDALESQTKRASGSDASLGERQLESGAARASIGAQIGDAARQARASLPLPAAAPPPPPPRAPAPAVVERPRIKPPPPPCPPYKRY
jgi:hypothetical protein